MGLRCIKKHKQILIGLNIHLIIFNKDLKDILQKELDFINEANNSKRCYKELKHLKFVYVPKVYDNLSTKVILNTEN
jgi:predicted unusual protein kinase regulating ubiquinone biosynthesis (AarF/ABC1/UbiB family)